MVMGASNVTVGNAMTTALRSLSEAAIPRAAARVEFLTSAKAASRFRSSQTARGLHSNASVRPHGVARHLCVTNPSSRWQRPTSALGMATTSAAAATSDTGTAVQSSRGLGLDGRFKGSFAPEPNPEFLNLRALVWDRLWVRADNDIVAKKKAPIQITMLDGSVREGVGWSTTPLDIATSISKGLASDAVVALVGYKEPLESGAANYIAADGDEEDDTQDDYVEGRNCELWDMTRPLEGSCQLEFIKFDDPRGRNVFWHSSSHAMGAVLEASFGGLLTIGPALETGFYYDMFLGDRRISEADYKAIEAGVEKLRHRDEPFRRLVLSREEALEMFADNPFKVDLIQRKVMPGAVTTAYRCGDLVDLCRGPHLPSTGRIKAFAVTKNSSAYWLGSAENDSLQRVYGVSFPSSKELKQHQKELAEAKERDHRLIGTQQDLFFFDGVVSAGSCFWTGYGTRIYNKLQELLRAEYRRRGFEEVITPNIYASELFKRSGHYHNYREDMYGFKVEGQEWFLKPMNCPGHCVIFDSRPRSHRELPLRLASFGVLHRNELSGTLTGLTRVRRFQQDDAHVFCRDDQIRDEVFAALTFVFDIYKLFGFKFSLALSTRPKKSLGGEELWNRAEMQLREALNETGHSFVVNKGDGAFYGPKIDIKLQDAMGRRHQCGTIQLDFQLPLRFNLRYQSEDRPSQTMPPPPQSVPGVIIDDSTSAQGATECAIGASVVGSPASELPAGFARPVILHRAILGSVERMVGVLCEHYAGKWPFWLSPRQCLVVPISEGTFEYAQFVKDTLHARGFHTEVDLSKKRMQKKVREAQVAQWNYIFVVGDEEEKQMTVNVRMRGETKPVGIRDLAELIEHLETENCPGALARPSILMPFRRRFASTGAPSDVVTQSTTPLETVATP
eukprot:TRINITY_DN23078_c0_g1_i1.p1 TRINITY_DN23078_c0_g1~~TRINITY_DN23078_c0_g1_i1.p1  ORF type:complete len:903 (-),score=146.49 TRINITY_DN23078_c0_g1_i1:66-2774(-)